MTRLLLADAAGIAEAGSLLRQGELVAFGTETVYGLGGDARQGRAMAAIFTAKSRPHFNPLICHYADAGAAFADAHASLLAEALARVFWPGPLTLVLPRRAGCRVNLLAGAGLDTLAVRVPSHPIARAVIAAADGPVAAPSANRSGGVSPTTAQHVADDLDGRIAAIVDCGACAVGVESTVVDLTGRPVLLRAGAVAADAIEAIVGRLERGVSAAHAQPHTGLRSPGLLASHYAPRLTLRLDAATVREGEALLAFGPTPPACELTWNLSLAGDLDQAAARLFAGLRWLDAEGLRRGLTGIAAMRVPASGLGEAINDRLTRAAAPRD